MAYQRNGYYYRSKREGDRVVTEYLGRGDLAEAIAQLDAFDRARRMEEAEAFRAECKDLDAVDAAVEQLCETAELLARGSLLAAGYHQHHRGTWRRRRSEQETGRQSDAR